MQALQAEVMPFGIRTTILNPGFFVQNCLPNSPQIMLTNQLKITMSEECNKCNSGEAQMVSSQATRQNWHSALVKIANEKQPPLRFIAGADAINTAEQVVSTLHQQLNAYRDLSSSLDYEIVQKATDENQKY
jgi:hypothetical protein